jgi:hypothetical protein
VAEAEDPRYGREGAAEVRRWFLRGEPARQRRCRRADPNTSPL